MKMHKFIRNFSIISHVDHGKSTLSDSMIITANPNEHTLLNTQVLDNMNLEKKHGITIKSNHINLDYVVEGQEYNFCLIDTPGHVDFSFEVLRSLRACEGVILLVDATVGIQAQTVANFRIARKHKLTIIPVINKIDMPNSDVQKTVNEIEKFFGISCKNCPLVSAKKMININHVFLEIVKKIAPPENYDDQPLQALVFDSYFDQHKGVILYVRIISGKLIAGDHLWLVNNQISLKVSKLMQKKIKLASLKSAYSGQIAIIFSNLKQHEIQFVGDTLVKHENRMAATAVPGFVRPRPVIYSNFYLSDNTKFGFFTKALHKIKLNDDSLTFSIQRSNSFGLGYLCGFLGSLHKQIVKERLETEYEIEIISGIPSVEYRVSLKNKPNALSVYSANKMPPPEQISKIEGLFCAVTICTPLKYYGRILDYSVKNGGSYKGLSHAGEHLYLLTVEMSLSRMIINYFDQIKSISNGYASITYEILDFRPVSVAKLNFLVNYENVTPLTVIVDKDDVNKIGKQVCEQLRDLIPACNFQIAIQAAVGGKIVARTTIKALRKNVTAKLYGGDVTRKMKLLKKQKAGKKRMKTFGKVYIPSSVFLHVDHVKK